MCRFHAPLFHAAPSAAPVNITIHDITSSDFVLQWLPPRSSDRNGIIRSYSVSLSNANTGVSTSYNTSGNSSSLHIQSLHPAHMYMVQIAAVTVLQGPFSDLIHVTMEEDSK